MRERIDPTRLYLAMRGVTAFAFALILTYESAYHAAVLGLSPMQLVLVGVVLESMTLIFELPTGVLADLYSRRMAVVAGVLLTGAGFMAEAVIPTFAAALAAQVLWGIGFTLYSGAEAAWLSDEIGVERARGVFLSATQIAQALAVAGTFLGAAMAQASVTLPIMVGAALYLVCGALLAMLMPEAGFQRPTAAGHAHFVAQALEPLRASARLFRTHPLLWPILVLGAVIGFSVGGFDRLSTAHLLRDTPPPAGALEPVTWLGLLNGAVSIASLVGVQIVRRRSRGPDQLATIRLLSQLYVGMLVGSAIFAAAGSFGLAAAGFCLSQALRNTSRPVLLAWISENAERSVRATVISAYWQANALGQIVGSPLLGWIGAAASLPWALGAGTAVYTAVLPTLALARRRWLRAGEGSVERRT
jgi:DHA3 family tetracycline resistance protein-like MFS transporter